jgi:Flp pilus assembly pilin Flp
MPANAAEYSLLPMIISAFSIKSIDALVAILQRISTATSQKLSGQTPVRSAT